MKSSIVTLTQLKLLDACQATRFHELFGESVEVTEELCIKHASDFDWGWAAERFLTPSASAEYDRECAAASAEYDRVRAAASAEYDRVRAAAWAEYDRVCAPASAEYDRVCAAAFARSFLNQVSEY